MIAPTDGRKLEYQVNKVVTKFSPLGPDEEYVLEYETKGHTPEVPKCLANAYEAGENAIEAGVIQETANTQAVIARKLGVSQQTVSEWLMPNTGAGTTHNHDSRVKAPV